MRDNAALCCCSLSRCSHEYWWSRSHRKYYLVSNRATSRASRLDRTQSSSVCGFLCFRSWYRVKSAAFTLLHIRVEDVLAVIVGWSGDLLCLLWRGKGLHALLGEYNPRMHVSISHLQCEHRADPSDCTLGSYLELAFSKSPGRRGKSQIELVPYPCL